MTGANRVEPSAVFLRFGRWAPVVYTAHLIDERFWPPGTAVWATTHTPLVFTNEAWLLVNVPSLVLFAWASKQTMRGRWAEWVAVALAIHLVLHALTRVAGSIGSGTVAPGTITGVVLCLPLAVPLLLDARRRLTSRDVGTGLVAGVASFQPIWHGLLHVLG